MRRRVKLGRTRRRKHCLVPRRGSDAQTGHPFFILWLLVGAAADGLDSFFFSRRDSVQRTGFPRAFTIHTVVPQAGCTQSKQHKCCGPEHIPSVVKFTCVHWLSTGALIGSEVHVRDVPPTGLLVTTPRHAVVLCTALAATAGFLSLNKMTNET